MTTLASEVQEAKALVPIIFTDVGIAIFFREMQDVKALLLINKIDVGITI